MHDNESGGDDIHKFNREVIRTVCPSLPEGANNDELLRRAAGLDS